MLNCQEIKRCFRSLLMHRLRSILSTLGILFGVAAMIAMLAIGEGAKQESLEQIKELGVNSIIIRQPLISEVQRVDALEHRAKGLTWEDAEALRQNMRWLIYHVPLKVMEAPFTGFLPHLSPEIVATTRHYGEMKDLQM